MNLPETPSTPASVKVWDPLVRIVWGFVGTRYARFSDFVYHPSTVPGYAKEMLIAKPKHYPGHNPLGGMMILALLVSLLAAVPDLVAPAMADDDDEDRRDRKRNY